MGMNPTLAAMYDTHGAGRAYAEESTKIAHLELFAKAAAAQRIDLSQLDPSTQEALFQDFTAKLAQEEGEGASESESSEPPAKEEEEKEEEEGEEGKEAAARREFHNMQEWQEKNAQADFLGRRMAHAFWDEYNEISKVAKGGPQVFQPKHKDTLLGAGKGAPGGTAKKTPEGAKMVKGLGERVREGAGAAGKHIAQHKGKYLAGAGAAAALGGAAYAAGRASKKKEASAFDVKAAEQGLKVACAAGWSEEECIGRLNSLLTLGVGESEKVAYAGGSYEDALNIRGLELLEEAGYPVDWNQVFG